MVIKEGLIYSEGEKIGHVDDTGLFEFRVALSEVQHPDMANDLVAAGILKDKKGQGDSLIASKNSYTGCRGTVSLIRIPKLELPK